MNKLTEWLTKPFLDENIDLPVSIGDTVKMGKFKNKKVVVKKIDWNEKGDLLINGRPALKFRVIPKTNLFDKEEVTEGVNDPGIFKAVFLAGGPGSGKTFAARHLFGMPDSVNISMSGMKMVNSDKELKFLLNKYGFGTDLDNMPDELFNQLTISDDDDYSGFRDYSKSLTKQRMNLYTDGRLGVIVDGTGHNWKNVRKEKIALEKLGYDTYMIFVNTTLEVAQQRNQERDRILPPKLLKDSWNDVQKNRGAFKSLFTKNFKEVQNSENLNDKQISKKFGSLARRYIKVFMDKPITNKIAKSWIKKQQILKKKGVSESLPTKINDKFKKLKNKPDGDADKDFTNHHKSSMSADSMGNWSEPDTYDFDDDDKEIGGNQNEKPNKKKKGYEPVIETPRVPRKKGQHRGSSSHSDLYTDENPKGTIKGLKFATVKDAKASVSKINSSGKTHAHKIQAAVAMEQRAKEMGKSSQAAVYRTFINKMKEKTKKKNEINIPSPSRKGVKKMKKMGNTSVPYGSGYKKVNENKKEFVIWGIPPKKSSEEILYTKAKSNSEAKKVLKILVSKHGIKKGRIQVLDLEQDPSKFWKSDNIFEGTSKIKKVVGVYGGRFQPFGPHHKKTYEWLKKRVDDAYITTSDIKQPPRHPMNFAEKVRHMTKMGIPKNRIIKEKSPYVAKNVLKKYDKDTTAVIYIFGAKDAGRLSGGKYFQDYKKNKNNMNGYEDNGYVLTAPHVSVSVGGKEVSGTVMRQLLGSPDFENNREKLFKTAFGYFDKGIYNMMTNKFKKLFESIDEFLINNDITKLIKESSNTLVQPTDDGPPTFYKGFSDYKKFSKKWIDDMYAGQGWEVLQYVLGKGALNPDYDYTLNYGTVPAIAYGHKQSGEYGTRFGVNSPIDSYKNYIENTVLQNLGYEIIKWMGITPDGKGYTGVDVETPVLPGVGKDNIGNTKKTKLKIKERFNLDEEVKLIIEGGAYGHMNHPFDDKNITFSDLKNIVILGLGGELNREDGVTEKLDGQNLMVSWVGGKLVTARNKGQLKNFGATAMDVAGVASKFAGRGDIRDAFVFAMKDLGKSIGSLSDKQKEKIFDNGKRWMNLEVMYPKSANVVDYDKAQIVFHGTLEYDDSAKAIGQPKDSARMLAGMIKQVNQNVQKHYTIGKPQFLTVSKVQDFGKKKSGFISRLNKLKNEYALNDNDTLSKYHQSFWEEFIFNASKQYNYDIPNKVLVDLTKRWAFFDKSYKIPTIKKSIDNKEFLDWVLSFDKNDHTKWVKQNMKPFEVLFFDVGAEILKNISGYLAASPDKAVQKIRKDVIAAIKKVKSGGDIKKIQTLKLQLDKLEKIGGLSSIVPSEGIVFKYKGKIYKFTGAFAPVNQILGLLNF